MSILFHWPESLKIETSIKEQNQHNIEDTLVNLDFLKKCSGTIHALCLTLFGHIFCDKKEITTFTCAPNGSNFST